MSMVRSAFAGFVVAAMTLLPLPALAGDPCDGLWYRRNAIYASAGYCFKTAAAIREFGRGCRPPYGRLSASQQRRVNRIIAKEQRHGC